jgi:hypothetical protein
MEFLPTTQNGIQPPTDYFTKPSTFALALSTTTFVYTQQIEMRAYSNAQVYKRNPVTFWAYSTITNTATVISTASWISTTTSQLFTINVPQNTTQIYATWPGELKYAPKSTEMNPINVSVIPGYILPEPVTISAQPNPGVINENVTLRASSTASVAITNGSRIDWYANGSNIGYSNFNQGSSVFTTTFVSTGTESIHGYWNGGILNGESYQGTPTNTISLAVNERGTLNSSLTLSVDPTISSSTIPFEIIVQLNTTTIFTGTTVTISGSRTENYNNITTSITTSTPTYSVSSSSVYSTGTQVGYISNGSWIYYHANGTTTSTSNTVISTASTTVTTTATVSNLIGYVNNITTASTVVSTTIVTTTSTTYQEQYGVPNRLGDPEGSSVYITITGNNPWTYSTNIQLLGFTFKSAGYWWTIATEPENNSGTIIPINVPPGHDPTTATLTSGYFNFYSGQALTTTVTTATTITTVSTSKLNSNYVINTTTSLINNTATITVPANTLVTGTYGINATWSGTTTAPKYYPINSNGNSIRLVEATNPSFNVTVTPSTFEYFDFLGNINTATISSTITVFNTSTNNAPAPTGTITLQDANGLTLGTGSLTSIDSTSSNSTITWNPYNINQLVGSNESLTVSYGGDTYYNTGTYYTPGILTIEKLKPSLSLGNRNLIISGSNQGYWYGGSVDLYANFPVYSSSRAPSSVTFYIDGNAVGTSTVTFGTVSLTNVSVTDNNYNSHVFTLGYSDTDLYSGTPSLTFIDTNNLGINGSLYGTTPPPGVYSINVTPYVTYTSGQYGQSIVNEHCTVNWNFTRSANYIIRIWYYVQDPNSPSSVAIQASVDETVTAQSGSFTGWYNSQSNPNGTILAKAEVLYNNQTIYGGRP